jgi:hypothetical protein
MHPSPAVALDADTTETAKSGTILSLLGEQPRCLALWHSAAVWCMATRFTAPSKVVTSPTTSTSFRCRSTCKLHALSLPELQNNRAFAVT